MQSTGREQFVYYSQRLMRLLVEYASNFLTYEKQTVVTPTGVTYTGLRLAGKVCGVSIVRAGETLERALCDVLFNVSIGKILIQSDEATGEPCLHYCKLPSDIAMCHVILMDATCATGAAALMAIRVLLDHDVPPERIIFISLIAAPQGIHAIAYAFPAVKVRPGRQRTPASVSPAVSATPRALTPGGARVRAVRRSLSRPSIAT